MTVEEPTATNGPSPNHEVIMSETENGFDLGDVFVRDGRRVQRPYIQGTIGGYVEGEGDLAWPSHGRYLLSGKPDDLDLVNGAPPVIDAMEAEPVRRALAKLRWNYMPSHGEVQWQQLEEAVSEALFGDRTYRKEIPDRDLYIGHRQVGINFNSLNRIVSAFARAARASAHEPAFRASSTPEPADASGMTPLAESYPALAPGLDAGGSVSEEELSAAFDIVGVEIIEINGLPAEVGVDRETPTRCFGNVHPRPPRLACRA